jgi:hypothetical protein
MEWVPQFGNEVFPRLPVVLAVVLSAGWLVGCRPSRGRSMALAGLGLALVLAVAQITVRCLFWGP